MTKITTAIKCSRFLNQPLFALLLLSIFHISTAEPAPPISLAKVYQQNESMSLYWVSEKLDGVRAYWDGQKLISRQGNTFQAPSWFIAGFPDQSLDGELWIARGRFEQLSSTVRKLVPVDSEWRNVKYMIFDLPEAKHRFDQRLSLLETLLEQHPLPHLQLIKQYRLADQSALQKELDRVTELGGEGLMLHLGAAPYQVGRHAALLKVKKFQDAEAKVIAHLPGKGKYKGMLGAVLVEMPDGKRFRIGSGFSDHERRNPPALGSQITYKYAGLTAKGLPRFASFLRPRQP